MKIFGELTLSLRLKCSHLNRFWNTLFWGDITTVTYFLAGMSSFVFSKALDLQYLNIVQINPGRWQALTHWGKLRIPGVTHACARHVFLHFCRQEVTHMHPFKSISALRCDLAFLYRYVLWFEIYFPRVYRKRTTFIKAKILNLITQTPIPLTCTLNDHRNDLRTWDATSL